MGHMHDMPNSKPDIMTVAKSISGGVTPVSGILADANIMTQIKAGEHGSTYGGNPLGMAVAKRAVEVLFEDRMVENSRIQGEYLASQIAAIDSPLILETRGRGLFQGIEFRHDQKVNANDLAKILFKNGMMTKSTHDFCIRLSPALVITQKEVDEGVEVISQSIKELEKMNEERH